MWISLASAFGLAPQIAVRSALNFPLKKCAAEIGHELEATLAWVRDCSITLSSCWKYVAIIWTICWSAVTADTSYWFPCAACRSNVGCMGSPYRLLSLSLISPPEPLSFCRSVSSIPSLVSCVTNFGLVRRFPVWRWMLWVLSTVQLHPASAISSISIGSSSPFCKEFSSVSFQLKELKAGSYLSWVGRCTPPSTWSLAPSVAEIPWFSC